MSQRFHPGEPATDGMRRIAIAQIEAARTDLALADRTEAVHELRKRCKKIRALLRLLRPALGARYTTENAYFRDLARSLGAVRDAQVRVETFDKLMQAYEGAIDRRHYQALRPKLCAAAETATGQADQQAIAEADAALASARDRVADWALSDDGFDAIGPGLKKTLADMNKQGRRARRKPRTTRLHEWRKCVKHHRHHCEMLHEVWPEPMTVRIDQLKRLSDELGDDHDLAELALALAIPDNALRIRHSDALQALIAERRAALQRQALVTGRRFAVEPAKRFTRRTAGYWRIAAGN